MRRTLVVLVALAVLAVAVPALAQNPNQTTIAIAASADTSNSVTLGTYTLVGVYAPAMEATTAYLVIEVSRDGGTTWATATDDDLNGTTATKAITVSSSAAVSRSIEPRLTYGLPMIRFKATTSDKSTAVTQTAIKTLKCTFRNP